MDFFTLYLLCTSTHKCPFVFLSQDTFVRVLSCFLFDSSCYVPGIFFFFFWNFWIGCGFVFLRFFFGVGVGVLVEVEGVSP